MNILLLLLSHALIFPEQPDIYLEIVGQNSAEKNWAFYAPHEDENVANRYVAQQISKQGGIFVVMRQSGKRLVNLSVGKQHVKLDPNRMFTHKGRVDSIKKLNPTLAPQSSTFNQAVQRAENLSLFVLKAMGGDKQANRTWVAIHNNTQGYDNDGNNGVGNISIKRYQKKLAANAQYLIDVTASNHDEDDLFFITDKDDFEQMKKHKWNAVLQNPNVAHDPSEDDGSLSVYAEMKNIRYLNVEAEREYNGLGQNHLLIQKKMVDFTFSLLETNN